MSHTRIVATIGPASCTPDMIESLLAAGMSMARLNGSHATPEWHRDTVTMLRAVRPELPILLDLPGRKIRTRDLAHEPSFLDGDTIILTNDQSHDGSQKVPVSADNLAEHVQPGDHIFMDDGTLSFVVVEAGDGDVLCRALTPGRLRSRKGVNVPKVPLGGELITERDGVLIELARDMGIDFVGLSFVESADHVRRAREALGTDGPAIVAKIENQRGLDNREEVIREADAIMIDRGDLSVETRLDTLAIMQKEILASARRHATPVIVATEMLHTMIDHAAPTKAEVTDISNAIIDGASATMLSGETAVGAHPVEAVKMMRDVAAAAEDYVQRVAQAAGGGKEPDAEIPEAVRDAVALLARQLPVTKIVAVTISGFAARVVASTRPSQPILAVSNDVAQARRLNLVAGTTGVHIDLEFPQTSTDHLMVCLRHLLDLGHLTPQDHILMIALAYPTSGNRMNLVQTHRIGDLIESQGW